MRSLSSGAGVVAALVLALIAVAFCFWPISGRSAEEWLPVVARHAIARALGRHVRLSPAPQAGARLGGRRATGADRLASRGRARPRTARRTVPRRDSRGASRTAARGTYTAALAVTRDVVRAPRPGRAGEPPGRLGRRARGSCARGIAGQPDPVGRANRPRRRRRDRPLPRRSLGTRLGPGRLALDAVVPRSDEHGPGGDDAITSSSSASRSMRSVHGDRSSERAARRDRTPARARVLLRELEALAERLTAADVRVVGALRPGHARDRDSRRVRPVVAARPRAARRRRPGAATASTRRPHGRVGTEDSWSATEQTARITRRTGSRAGRVSTSAPRSSLRSCCTRRWCGRSRSRSSRSRRSRRSARSRPSRTSDIADRELRGRMGFIETAEAKAPDRGRRPPRRGARRRSRRRPLRRLRHRLRAHPRRARARTAPRSSTPPRWRGSSSSASTGSRRRRSPTRFPSAAGCGEAQGPAGASRHDRARTGGVSVRRRGRARRPRRLHRPRRLRRLLLLRPLGAVRQGADEPERRRHRDRRPREVEPRQDVRAAPVGVRPAGVDRRRQGRVRPARGGARRAADRALARRRRQAQPAHAARRTGAAAQPPLLGRRRRARAAAHARGEACRPGGARRSHAALRTASRRCPTSSTCSSDPTAEMATALAMDVGDIANAVRPMAFALDQLCSGKPQGHVRRPDDAGTRSRRAARRPEPSRRSEHAHDGARDPDDLRHRLAAGADRGGLRRELARSESSSSTRRGGSSRTSASASGCSRRSSSRAASVRRTSS